MMVPTTLSFSKTGNWEMSCLRINAIAANIVSVGLAVASFPALPCLRLAARMSATFRGTSLSKYWFSFIHSSL